MEVATFRLQVSGLVQGIGFRPFIFRLAAKHGILGQVENRNDGVVIELNSSGEEAQRFLEHMIREAPEASSIEHVELSEIASRAFSDFTIRQSTDISDGVTEISPDIAVCSECLEDLELQPHRINYPLVNCTHCGPRFSIIKSLPYDRLNTTMSHFAMCPDCMAEFNNPLDRRFHAQPVACNHCGPAYSLITQDGITKNLSEILEKIGDLTSRGALLAIKGTGGFHLVCDAFNEEGVRKLRRVKERDEKPFALMFRDINEAQSFVKIKRVEAELLKSWKRPIVLLEKKKEITPGIADGLSTLGIMLPYMPFHHLLFKWLKTPALVATSANLSEEPILISE